MPFFAYDLKAQHGRIPSHQRAHSVPDHDRRDHMFNKFLAATAMAVSLSTPSWAADIVDTAVGAGTFNTLVAAVEAADLVDTLKGEGPFTVFAPSDEAFAALPEGTVENLLKPENKDQLIAILTYHVVPGKVMSGDIAGKQMMVETVQGSEVDVNATDGVMVDGAKVVSADIEADNGVIHVIDAVIIPE
jgi:uncharacterized surface protein with fasciclin (FAS1) repeats